MNNENYEHAQANISLSAYLSESCRQICSIDAVEERLKAMAIHALALYAANSNEQPINYHDDTEVAITIEANATCLGGRRKLLGGIKCSLEATCQLTAVYDNNSQ